MEYNEAFRLGVVEKFIKKEKQSILKIPVQRVSIARAHRYSIPIDTH